MDRPEHRENLKAVFFHIHGVVDSATIIAEQLEILQSVLDIDLEEATDCLGRLEAELFHHLTYHLQELEEPFHKAVAQIYETESGGSGS